jgi:hypothetical protein
MPRHGCWRALALLGISFCGGCLGFVHPVAPLGYECIEPCQQVPQACKNRVYVFLLQDVDPFDMSNLDGVCDYLHSLGFIKTYLGMPYHVCYFEKEIRRIHEKEPTSRFVLVGFGCGAPLARGLTCKLEQSQIPVDLLVYIDGLCMDQKADDHPVNACHVVTLVAGKKEGGDVVVQGEYIECDKAWHFGTPTHPETLKMLARELPVVAQRVPVIDVLPEPIEWLAPRRPGLPMLPPPQPGTPVLPPPTPGAPANVLPPPTPAGARGDWYFLQPDGNSVVAPGMQPSLAAPMGAQGETRHR